MLFRRFNARGVEADDLFQTVVLHLYGNDWHVLQQWNGASRFNTYLAAVVVNRATDYYRRGSNRPIPGGEDLEQQGDGDSEGHAQEEEIRGMVSRMMELLSRDHAECYKLLKMKYFHDMTYREIAEIIDKTVNHVGVLLHRCLERCRTLLGCDNPLG